VGAQKQTPLPFNFCLKLVLDLIDMLGIIDLNLGIDLIDLIGIGLIDIDLMLALSRVADWPRPAPVAPVRARPCSPDRRRVIIFCSLAFG
jgi:hypothetical protein